MSLRAKLLLLFFGLAVAPLCALGLFNHVQTMRGLEALLARQTRTLAETAGRAIDERLAVQRSDLLMLAENLETRRLLEARRQGDPARFEAALSTADPFLQQLWRQYGPWYRTVEIRDSGGALVYFLGEAAARDEEALGWRPDDLLFRQPVPDGLGEIVAYTRSEALLPPEALGGAFGERGFSVVVERGSGRVLYHPEAGRLRQPIEAVLGVLPEALASSGPAALRLGAGDSLRIGSYVAMADPAWTVLATASLAEFAPPFVRVRNASLIALLLVTLGVSTAFAVAIRRATGRLEALTSAADALGRGDLAPVLPPAGRDEVGRLTVAFGLMTAKLREMMLHLERSRQMAAIGSFASEVAHEIRNPLTSVKLNLQRIERLVAQDRTHPGAEAPLRISLREIERLERVVRGVLHLGRPRTLTREPCPLHAVIERSLETVKEMAARQGVRIQRSLEASTDTVAGDAEQLQGALLNVLLNALEAMPGGGTLRVETKVEERDGGDVLVLRITDSGPGIPYGRRERLFEPFHSTKPDGTGLGLAIALRTAEEHGGGLKLEADAREGAAFRFELPLQPEGVGV